MITRDKTKQIGREKIKNNFTDFEQKNRKNIITFACINQSAFENTFIYSRVRFKKKKNSYKIL